MNMRFSLILIISCLLFNCKQDKKNEVVETKTVETKIEATKERTPIIENSKTEPVTNMANYIIDSEIKITPINHGTLVIEYSGTTIYVDPVGGKEAFENQKKPSLLLVTDIHGDHFNIETIKAFDAPLLAPKAVSDKIKNPEGMDIIVMNNGETRSFEFDNNKITIEAIPMYNLREEALKFHEKGRGNGYVLTINDKRIYISGDTEDIPEMRTLKNIDVAFICMNLPYTMTVESAASAVLDFKPKKALPYHYRGTEGLSDVELFKSIVNKEDDNINVIQLKWYD